MKLSVAIPGHIRAFRIGTVPDWARQIERLGFDGMSVTDRRAWPTPEPMTSLAAAAAVTARIQLLSSVVLAPPRASASTFASEVATVDHLAGAGRLRLGLAPGGRASDYVDDPTRFEHRGRDFDTMLARLKAHWNSADEDAVGPAPATAGGPPLLFGGHSQPTIRRVVEHGAGWIAGGLPPEAVNRFRIRIADAAAKAGRHEHTETLVSIMVSLGPDTAGAGLNAIGEYYHDLGEDVSRGAVAATVTDPHSLRASIRAYGDAGADHIIMTVNDPDPDSLTSLAQALGLL
ncbi:LLM class flavin-dependent oxidoreductase [Rhodococcoides yunnanense]|uniref:LLM class flavin-dependent oxidoreductase n=1 Tax=Rhodococcoides yunnanense TaxID=278209 RepID=A0ABU4BK51_9NOCA|nr:LLM class flavin-dependent oxidoreductase [Rhodococcus yunnanensis]MDV6264599.1 LLM class flavin-dependent oxidoreductase [Rhodococcus yunnanensis]